MISGTRCVIQRNSRKSGTTLIRPGKLLALLRFGALVAIVIFAGCASAPPASKRSFVGAGEEPRAAQPDGLNPLGSLETCESRGGTPVEGMRVMISRPEEFTREASLMILALRESMVGNEETSGEVEMVLSDAPLNTIPTAVEAGQRCNAMIVLWERRGSRTLELTLPRPTQIPLRAMVRDKLCEFGDHAEQVTILYLTIRGLAAIVANDYEQANGFFLSANRLDDRCFQLPLAEPSDSTSETGKPTGRDTHESQS